MFDICYEVTGKKEGFSKEKAAKIIMEAPSDKIFYRYGFGWKGASEGNISKNDAMKKIENSWTDITVKKDNSVHINQYSENDMY